MVTNRDKNIISTKYWGMFLYYLFLSMHLSTRYILGIDDIYFVNLGIEYDMLNHQIDINFSVRKQDI